jgi:hypothetical protein
VPLRSYLYSSSSSRAVPPSVSEVASARTLGCNDTRETLDALVFEDDDEDEYDRVAHAC